MNGIGSHLDYDMSIDSKITEIFHAISVYVRMDRDWINLPRINADYENGVREFIKFTQRYEGRSDDEVKFRCPYVNYLNGRKLNTTKLGNILFVMVP